MSAPFTHEEYKSILALAKARGYQFADHDCDNDLAAAIEMAEIEHALGVRATYFLMLRAPLYNLLAPGPLRLARRLSELGHAIGLHFDDLSQEGVPIHDLAARADRERTFLAQELGVPVDSISFHQAGKHVAENRVKLSCINMYDHDDMAGIQYFSDTNMSWRVPPHVALDPSVHPRIQFLFHPEWWTPTELSIKEKWERMFQDNFQVAQSTMLSRERAYDWIHDLRFDVRGRREGPP
jgi:hypothetical protein